MNCPICKCSDVPGFLKENFKAIFESSTTHLSSTNQELGSELIFDPRLDGLVNLNSE